MSESKKHSEIQIKTCSEQTAPEERVGGPTGQDTSDSIPESSVKELGGKLKAELETYKDLALRARADLDNYRKRMAREKEEATRYANAGFLEKLIPILDNFEFGLQAARSGSSDSAVLDGMTMVYKQLQDFLAGSGVETIDATGQQFDPNLHEAIAQEEHPEAEEGTVVRQIRKGYKLRDRLIRPANVVVAKGAPASISKSGTQSGR
jgi:molecular chaperone GrpE